MLRGPLKSDKFSIGWEKAKQIDFRQEAFSSKVKEKSLLAGAVHGAFPHGPVCGLKNFFLAPNGMEYPINDAYV